MAADDDKNGQRPQQEEEKPQQQQESQQQQPPADVETATLADGATASSDEKKHARSQSHSDTSSTAGSVRDDDDTAAQDDDEKKSPSPVVAKSPERHDGILGPPDIDHEEAEGATPGHALDVELAQVRSTTPTSSRSPPSPILTTAPARPPHARLHQRQHPFPRVARALPRPLQGRGRRR